MKYTLNTRLLLSIAALLCLAVRSTGQETYRFPENIKPLITTRWGQQFPYNLYAPQAEGAIAWNDPQIGIDWQIDAADVILSEKDKHHPLLKDAEWLFDYNTQLY